MGGRGGWNYMKTEKNECNVLAVHHFNESRWSDKDESILMNTQGLVFLVFTDDFNVN